MTIEEDDKLLNDKEDPKVDEAARWSEKVFEKYNILHDIAIKNMPNIWTPLEFALSIKTILNIRGCIKPFGGILLGPPSSLKTVTIGLFRGCQHTFYSDNFTAKSMVSHNSAIKRDKLKDVDMLPKLKNNFFLTPELAPMFASREEDLLETLGIMTRILDGEGYENDTGAQGHRGYSGEYMFTWLGASVDIPHRVHKALSTLGPRLFFLRLPKLKQDEDYYFKQMGEDFEEKVTEICTALYEYMAVFETHPQIAFEEDELPKIPLNHTKNEESVQRIIIKLGELLAPLRAEVPTWETNGTQGSEYAYSIPTIEEPMRAIRQLHNLAWAHGLTQGRDYMTEDDISLIIQVVLSTCSIERARIFDLLIEHKGVLTTSLIVTSLNVTNPTARRTMTELKATGLVEMYGVDNTEKTISLKSEFSWFLSDRFAELRGLKEKCPPRYTTDSNINNKNQIEEGKVLSDKDSLRGGQNSFSKESIHNNNIVQQDPDSNKLKDIPKETWKATTIIENPSTLSTTCIYCNQSVANTELVAHMDKCAAEAVAEYERKRSLDN